MEISHVVYGKNHRNTTNRNTKPNNIAKTASDIQVLNSSSKRRFIVFSFGDLRATSLLKPALPVLRLGFAAAFTDLSLIGVFEENFRNFNNTLADYYQRYLIY